MQSVEMGGKRSFFKGEVQKYSWSNIFDPRLGGMEMLNAVWRSHHQHEPE